MAKASRRVMKKAPGEARKVMDNVKEAASSVGEKAGGALETMTKAVASAAGAVVGTVQSAINSATGGNSSDEQKSGA